MQIYSDSDMPNTITVVADIRAHVSDETKKCRQQQVHTMQGDIADTDTATDNYSYKAVSLRFKEARESSKTLWHWQEVDTTVCRKKDTGRGALADTHTFSDSFSLADSFLVDSAPQDLHMRASVNTAQAPFAIFLVEDDLEDTPRSLPTSHPPLKTL
jgi:hypothetical protein